MASSSTSLLSPPFLSYPALFSLSPLNQKLRLHRSSFSLSSISLSLPPRFKKLHVSIAPVEQAPSPEFNFGEEISRLRSLRSKLKLAKSAKDKLRVLDSDSRVRDFFKSRKGWSSKVLGGMERSEVVLIKLLVAAGQEHVLGVDCQNGGVRAKGSALKSSMHVLGDMVESWSLNGVGGAGAGGGKCEEMRKLLKILGEVEEFYDCIGGIIG